MDNQRTFSKLLRLSESLKKLKEAELIKIPQSFNVIQLAANGQLKETAHSAILQNLLSNQKILNSFVTDIIGLKDLTIRREKVRPAEKDRFDVSIRDENLCIIIENKINDACEQQGQIYRYVEKMLGDGYAAEQIIVVYLNSTSHYKPSDHSLSKDGKGKEYIPELVRNTMIVKDYKHDIYNWLKTLLPEIPMSQCLLRSGLDQYIDYLENKFMITSKFAPMNKAISELIEKECLLGIDSSEKQIDALLVIKNQLSELQTSISNLISSKKVDIYQANINQLRIWLGKKNLQLTDMCETAGRPNALWGLPVTMNGKSFYIAAEYNEEEQISWFGVYAAGISLEDSEVVTLKIALESTHSGRIEGDSDCWRCYVNCDPNQIYAGFTLFIEELSRLKIVF